MDLVQQENNKIMSKEQVNHPSHYNNHPSEVETIEVIRSFCFNLGSAFKYIFRRDDKENPIQDLNKAIWYIDDEIQKRYTYKYFLNVPDIFKYTEYKKRTKLVENIMDSEEDENIAYIYHYLNRADFYFKHIFDLLIVKSCIEELKNKYND